jgi:hypothetical protein
MQTAQKLEAEALGQDDDAPMTQHDLQKLHAKLDEISNELAAVKRTAGKQSQMRSEPKN